MKSEYDRHGIMNHVVSGGLYPSNMGGPEEVWRLPGSAILNLPERVKGDPYGLDQSQEENRQAIFSDLGTVFIMEGYPQDLWCMSSLLKRKKDGDFNRLRVIRGFEPEHEGFLMVPDDEQQHFERHHVRHRLNSQLVGAQRYLNPYSFGIPGPLRRQLFSDIMAWRHEQGLIMNYQSVQITDENGVSFGRDLTWLRCADISGYTDE